MELLTVHVAEWSGIVKHAVSREYDPELAVIELNKVINDDILKKGLSIPVASYIISEDEVDEITLQGPQLMVRGQPISCRGLTTISTVSYPI